MHLTRMLLKKVKSKHCLVLAESTISGRKLNVFRERAADKVEFIHFDPYIQDYVVYKELKRIRSASFGNDFVPFKGFTSPRTVYENEPDIYIPKLKNKLH